MTQQESKRAREREGGREEGRKGEMEGGREKRREEGREGGLLTFALASR